MRSHSNTPERFWAKVDQSGECWLWPHSTSTSGYGHLSYQGRVIDAHVLAYELTYGPVPDGLFVCHTCDHKTCIKPAHLFPGTHQQNMDDMANKGRGPIGERHGGAKLTEAQVVAMRERAVKGEGVIELAAEYGVKWFTANSIVRHKTWKHVSGPKLTTRRSGLNNWKLRRKAGITAQPLQE